MASAFSCAVFGGKSLTTPHVIAAAIPMIATMYRTTPSRLKTVDKAQDNSPMSRACVIVLDGVGAGALPDADRFGDEGSNTLGNVARAVGGLDLPNMEALGLGNVAPLEGCPPQPGAPAVAGRLLERSSGKDTMTGHWELMGLVTPQPMPTYPHGFPFEVIDPFMHRTGRGVLREQARFRTR